MKQMRIAATDKNGLKKIAEQLLKYEIEKKSMSRSSRKVNKKYRV